MAVGNIYGRLEAAITLATGATVLSDADMVSQAQSAIATRLAGGDLAIFKQAISSLGITVNELGVVLYFQATDGSGTFLKRTVR